MKNLSVFLFATTFFFTIVGMAHSETILFEDFEDSFGFTLAGAVPQTAQILVLITNDIR